MLIAWFPGADVMARNEGRIVKDDIARAARTIAESRYVVAFTGAGISAESGLPTYRGEGGMWSRFDPDKFASAEFFAKDPSYYWRFFKEERYPSLMAARPNPGHEALARLERTGRLRCIITQNIDGLHQMAGSEHVVELHGNTRTAACTLCSKTYTLEKVAELFRTRDVPLCLVCGGVLRTLVVLFGEPLPQEALRESFRQASACDAMLCVGSSLAVYPAAGMPQIAAERGAALIIVNPDPTPLDSAARFVLRGKAGEILPRIL